MTTSAAAPNPARYYADAKAPVCPLVIKDHFNTLSPKEKLYAHHIAAASWIGARIVLEQTTPHASGLFDLLREVFSAKGQPTALADLDKLAADAGVSADEFTGTLEYAVQVFNNLANYKSFGDSKFIPRVPAAAFRKVVAAAPNAGTALPKYDALEEEIYGLSPAARTLLGYLDAGHVTNYYEGDITQDDIKAVGTWCEARGLDPLNTRLFKTKDGKFELRIASAEKSGPEAGEYDAGERKVVVTYGDYAPVLAGVAAEIAKAIPYAANEHQKKMLEHYVTTFTTGSVDAHKDSQREWIQDIGPAVETNIGFVETYRDPAGVRAEWEGFVAVVNKEQTKKFERLVAAAPEFIPQLPWSKDFEKDKFHKPDFTSLEVLTFATAGVPAGINIPNFDDIRQTFGFKNVSLGNVLNAKAPDEKITFLDDADVELFKKLRGPAFEVQVGIHELLGHGTGKLLQEERDGSANFDKANPPTNPLTGKPVEHWYGPGETWGSRFKAVASSYEECRAESVAMFLSTSYDVLKVFGHDDKSVEEGLATDILYVAWLQMARAGLLALEFYDPAAKKWGQAHMQARYAITRVFQDAGHGFVSIDKVGDDDLRVRLDRSKIETIGKDAIGHFLLQLQVYKATGDAAAGTELYNKVTSVPDEWLAYRDIVIAKRQPRKVLLQANTFVEGGEVVLKEYAADEAGVIQSFLERTI